MSCLHHMSAESFSMSGESHRQHSRRIPTLILFAAIFVFAFGGFVKLGLWQLERRAWKLDLIERVETRVHAAPVAAPSRDEWPLITVARDEYKHVRVDGYFLPGKDTRVQAVTNLGAGFWLLSPLQTADGNSVLINRGFIPPDWKGATPSNIPVTVTGLLRLSEPKGGFLRDNDAAAERWYSRDVQAIAAARSLRNVAPFFIDADNEARDDGAAPRWPRGGLTVIRFSNNHMQYALTWFALALMVAGAGAYLLREELRLRKRHDD